MVGGVALNAQVGQRFRLEGGPRAGGGLGAFFLQSIVKHGQNIAALTVVILQRLGERRQLTDLFHLAAERRTTASTALPRSDQLTAPYSPRVYREHIVQWQVQIPTVEVGITGVWSVSPLLVIFQRIYE